jgi:general secretion pathway protein K
MTSFLKAKSQQERGIALLLTILVVTLLTIVVMEFTYSTEVEAHLTRNALSVVQGRYLARAGVALAEIALQVDYNDKHKNPAERAPEADTLNDAWAQPFPPQPIGDGVGEAGFNVEDLSGRFNVNSLAAAPGKSPPPPPAASDPGATMGAAGFRNTAFQGILSALGLETNLLFPLIDWLDPDDDMPNKSGAEREYYLGLTPPYMPRNGKLLRLEELTLVKGFSDLTREQWFALRSMLTVLPTNELLINVNTAPEALLAAILTSVDAAATAKAIVGQREQHPFLSTEELKSVPGWAQLPKEASAIFGLKSPYLTIHGIGVAGDVTRGVAVTERRNGARLEVLEWREEAPTVALTSPGPSVGMSSFRP